ncbi:uncharacterized protein LOC136030557 [Artemia franciscana]|uniref:Stathmin n=1 Tax=Artemia franciscana TaxID=6661 RepID=A0AA88HI78_ARTSF|nr:hypothetical protein QYM36_015827 [Artemia franciscana]KAK2705563.1 hypothetical protein QYM36_015827 [Artemia franciscana]
MGCTSSKVRAIDIKTDEEPSETNGAKALPDSIAYEIDFDEEMDDKENSESGAKFQPPKRLQKILTQDKEINLTPELIAGKQAEAEKRRLEALQQRIQSARRAQLQILKNRKNENGSTTVPGQVGSQEEGDDKSNTINETPIEG